MTGALQTFVIRHLNTRHLQSIALGYSEHFINRRQAADHFQPGVFAQGAHAGLAGRFADFPATGPIVRELPDSVIGNAQFENSLPSIEAKITARSAANGPIQWLSA